MTNDETVKQMGIFAELVRELFNEQDFGGGIYLYITTPHVTSAMRIGSMPVESYKLLQNAAVEAAPIEWIVK